MASVAVQPFQLSGNASKLFRGKLGSAIARLGERVLSLHSLNQIYASIPRLDTKTFCTEALHALGVNVVLNHTDLHAIPTSGPLIFVANHPYGGLDGLILMELMQRVRPDSRLLANYLLSSVPELRTICFFVDPFGGEGAHTRNRATIKKSVDWVEAGGALGIFPAGEVSHLSLWKRCVTDAEWSTAAARLALRTDATVVPVYFHGMNSPIFQTFGLLHPRFRTAMLPHELLRQRGRSVRVEIGTPIFPNRLKRFRDNGGVCNAPTQEAAVRATEYLRLRTYILKGRTPAISPVGHKTRKQQMPLPIVAPIPSKVLEIEIGALPSDQCLVTSDSNSVYFATAEQIPHLVREIGRLREKTFRLVGEGTGREIDLDHFDNLYLHLFVWDQSASRIVGAYRIGQTDVLLPRLGAKGLYTSTLFRYQPTLLEQLTPALELGRSFVIPECQRDYAPLLLLWKGIGRFVATHPQYKKLFGAVSISDDFQTMTKQLLIAFLRTNCLDKSLAPLVQAKTPPRPADFRHINPARIAALVDKVEDVEELVGEIESNCRKVPVLLRQYLKLNAKLLGFNLDPAFGDVVDGLVLVDLTKVERAILNRYLGRDGAAAFLAFHESRQSI